VRSTTFLFTTLCTSFQLFGVTRVQTGAQENISASRAVPPARAPTHPSRDAHPPEAARPEGPRPECRGIVPATVVLSPAPACAAGVPAAYKSTGSASRVRAAATPALAAIDRPATRPEPPAGASRGRRGEPRAQLRYPPPRLAPARARPLAHRLHAAATSPEHAPPWPPPRELTGATTAPTKGQN
jgi:hypothetical protein